MCKRTLIRLLLVCLVWFARPRPALCETGLFLTDPHRPVILEGTVYPAVNIRVDGDGTIRGRIVQVDDRVHGAISTSFDRKTVVPLIPFSVRGNRTEKLVVEGSPPGPGRYEFDLDYSGSGQSTHRIIPFTVLPAEQFDNGVRIDRDGTCYRDGKPWLPMVIYTNSAASKNGGSGSGPLDSARDQFLDYFEGTPFVMMDYCSPRAGLDYAVDYMNRCAQRNIMMSMHAAPSVISTDFAERLAEQLWDHPAMALWYINDELSNDWYDELKDIHYTFRRYDPFHATHVQHCDMAKGIPQAETYDIYVHQFYNGGERQIRKNFNYMIDLTETLPPTIPYWGNMLLYDDKLRTMSYGCIANGAKGLMYYAFHVMRDKINNWDEFNRRWSQIVEMGREIESRQHILLQPPSQIQSTANVDELALRTVSGDHGAWLLIVNPYWKTRDVDITVGVQTDSAVSTDGRTWPVRGGRFRMTITPEDVWLLQLTPPPAKTDPDFNNDGVVNFLDFSAFIDGVESL